MIALLYTALIALFILFIGFILGIIVGRHLLIHKSMGEALVADVIATRFNSLHVLLNNVTLETEDGTTQIDHILITETGIFVIETKHYQGWIYGGPNQSHWTQVIFKKKSKFQNPIRQNYGHVKTVQSLFTLPADNFIPLIVFTGDAEFKTDLGPTVIQLNQLPGYLVADRPAIFDERKMAYIVGRIEMKRLPRSSETDEYHLNFVRQRLNRA
jgi:hypothetical protein